MSVRRVQNIRNHLLSTNNGSKILTPHETSVDGLVQPTTLVVGGSGPTGPHLIDGLLERGHRVTMLHTGTHKPQREWYSDGTVEVVLSNPFKFENFSTCMKGRSFDYAFIMYGRLRMIVPVIKNIVKRVFTVGGLAVYEGFGVPESLNPTGMLVPQFEHSNIATSDGSIRGEPNHENVKINRIIETEKTLFEHIPTATHFRYPWVYAEDAMSLHEYSIVKRVLDGRKDIILPDGGLTLQSRGYSLNIVHAMLLALDKEKESLGEIYNVADEQALTLRQIVEVVCKSLGKPMLRVINVPSDMIIADGLEDVVCPWGPMIRKRSTCHELVAIGKIMFTLGYRDVLPASEATAKCAKWMAKNLPKHSSTVRALQDPFDYQAEDAYIAAFLKGDRSAMKRVSWSQYPGFTAFGYTTEKNPFDGLNQNQRHEGEYDPIRKRRM